jgi:hypothetical protein
MSQHRSYSAEQVDEDSLARSESSIEAVKAGERGFRHSAVLARCANRCIAGATLQRRARPCGGICRGPRPSWSRRWVMAGCPAAVALTWVAAWAPRSATLPRWAGESPELTCRRLRCNGPPPGMAMWHGYARMCAGCRLPGTALTLPWTAAASTIFPQPTGPATARSCAGCCGPAASCCCGPACARLVCATILMRRLSPAPSRPGRSSTWNGLPVRRLLGDLPIPQPTTARFGSGHA